MIRAWTPEHGVFTWKTEAHSHAVMQLLAVDGANVLISGGNTTLRAYDATTGAPLWSATSHNAPIHKLLLHPDAHFIISVAGRELRKWRATDGWAFPWYEEWDMFTRNRNQCFSRLWRDPMQLPSTKGKGKQAPSGPQKEVLGLTALPADDIRKLAAATQGGKNSRSGPRGGHEYTSHLPIVDVAFSRDGSFYVATPEDVTIVEGQMLRAVHKQPLRLGPATHVFVQESSIPAPGRGPPSFASTVFVTDEMSDIVALRLALLRSWHATDRSIHTFKHWDPFDRSVQGWNDWCAAAMSWLVLLYQLPLLLALPFPPRSYHYLPAAFTEWAQLCMDIATFSLVPSFGYLYASLILLALLSILVLILGNSGGLQRSLYYQPHAIPLKVAWWALDALGRVVALILPVPIMRWLWLGFQCNYFDDPGTALLPIPNSTDLLFVPSNWTLTWQVTAAPPLAIASTGYAIGGDEGIGIASPLAEGIVAADDDIYGCYTGDHLLLLVPAVLIAMYALTLLYRWLRVRYKLVGLRGGWRAVTLSFCGHRDSVTRPDKGSPEDGSGTMR